MKLRMSAIGLGLVIFGLGLLSPGQLAAQIQMEEKDGVATRITINGTDRVIGGYSKGGAVLLSVVPTLVGFGGGVWAGIALQDFWTFAGISMGSLALLPSAGYVYLGALDSKGHLFGLGLRTAGSVSTLLLWWGAIEVDEGPPAEGMAILSLGTFFMSWASAVISFVDVAEQTDKENGVALSLAPTFSPKMAGKSTVGLSVNGTF